jgi:hypothetical protein
MPTLGCGSDSRRREPEPVPEPFDTLHSLNTRVFIQVNGNTKRNCETNTVANKNKERKTDLVLDRHKIFLKINSKL